MQFDLTSSPTCPLGSLWRDAYRAPTSSALTRHFGHSGGITQLFPCMRDQYKWGAGRPDVLDARVPIKNNTEYHGLDSTLANGLRPPSTKKPSSTGF
jgi:hypothetical protein